MMERKMVLTAVVLVGLLCGAVAQADLYINTAFNSGGESIGGADTYVSNGAETSTDNYGTETRMKIRFNGGNSFFFAAYLRFDVGAMTGPFGADTKLQLTSTYLQVFNTRGVTTKGPGQGPRTLYIYGLTDNDTDDNWIESGAGGITYANAPGMLAAPPGNSGIDPLKLTLLGTIKSRSAADFLISGDGTAANPYIYNNGRGGTCSNGAITDTVWSEQSQTLVDFLNADANGLATLVLIEKDGTSAVNNQSEFGTKENTTAGVRAPALVPEPATMMILGLGSLILSRARRR